MTLDTYLTTENLSSTTFGEKVSLSGPSVHRIRKGEQNVSLDLAIAIQEATGGQVTVADLALTREQARAA